MIEKKDNEENLSKKGDSENELESCRKLAQEYLDGWKRTKADFINYKNEQTKFFEEFKKKANSEVIKDLIPVLDSLDEAVKKSPPESGFNEIKSQFLLVLKKRGLNLVEETGIQFDPKIHEALEIVEGSPPGQVREIIQRGYILNGNLLRPAKVKINKQ
ncbi:nucleotide exchange factor GrpE [Candidatus Parcubacteria bacterium]|nr:MAG: nucleotide exchange factor GrpE [Candidatus Parcubacteria bacterium]